MSNIDVQLLGYRFKPTDEEIISYYLERKMAGLHFPHNVVNQVDICNFEPWELPSKYPSQFRTHMFYII